MVLTRAIKNWDFDKFWWVELEETGGFQLHPHGMVCSHAHEGMSSTPHVPQATFMCLQRWQPAGAWWL